MGSYVFERISDAVLPYRNNLIVCMETAADFLSLSNGGMYESDIQAYSNILLTLPDFTLNFRSDCFTTKKYEERHGIFCTIPEQTILDLLEHEGDVDIQTLLESLSNYYFEHHDSFNGLEAQMNKAQQHAFEKWRQDSIDYHTED